MEANVAEAEFVDGRFELRLAVVANECARDNRSRPHRSKNRSRGLTACATSRSIWRDVGLAGSAEKVIVKNARQNEANPVRRFIRNSVMLVSFVNVY